MSKQGHLFMKQLVTILFSLFLINAKDTLTYSMSIYRQAEWVSYQSTLSDRLFCRSMCEISAMDYADVLGVDGDYTACLCQTRGENT